MADLTLGVPCTATFTIVGSRAVAPACSRKTSRTALAPCWTGLDDEAMLAASAGTRLALVVSYRSLRSGMLRLTTWGQARKEARKQEKNGDNDRTDAQIYEQR